MKYTARFIGCLVGKHHSSPLASNLKTREAERASLELSWCGRLHMRKVIFALATIALLCEPAIALPIDPVPMALVASKSDVVPVYFGHERVARRTIRRGQRHIRRMYIRRHY